MIRRARFTQSRAQHHLLHRVSWCTRTKASTLSPLGVVEDSNGQHRLSKHLPGGSTNGTNNGNIISSSARSSIARIDGSIIIVISKRACAGAAPGGFSHDRSVRLHVDGDEEEMDMDGEDAIAPKVLPERPGAKGSEYRGAPDNPLSFLFVVPALCAERGAGRSSSKNGRASRNREDRHGQHRLLFHGLARPVFRRPLNRAGYVTHPFGVYDHQTRVTFVHVCKHKGERKHVNPGARHRLGLVWGPENALAKRPGTRQRGTEASSGSPFRGH